MVSNKNTGILILSFLLSILFLTRISFSFGFEDLISKEIKIADDYKIIVNNKIVKTDIPPLQLKDKIYVPLKFISEHLGAEVNWFAQSKSIKISFSEKNIKRDVILWIGEKKLLTSGKLIDIKDVPFIYKSITYLPLKFTVLSLGGEVKEDKKSIKIVLKNTSKISDVKNNKNKKIQEILVKTKNRKYPKEVGWATRTWIAFATKITSIFKDEIVNNKSNKIMAPLVIILWCLSLLIFIIKWKNLPDKSIFLFLLFPITLIILFITKSTYWAAMVPVGTSLVGLLSSGTTQDKIDVMSDTAPYLGLVCTFLGLGEVIGPAIAAHNVDMIGYGIAVKIEASVCGMLIRILIRTLFLKPQENEEE